MPVKTIIARLSLLFAPLVIWQMVELFVLPVDLFTFRFWEALVAQRVHLLPGPFYPNTYLEKYSAGDLASRGPRRKLVRFHSDRYGQRNPPRGDKAFEIVIIGDSNIMGSHIDEPDTIRAEVESRCNCSVYAYGSGLWSNILSFLEDDRFERNPPAYVVLEFRPGDFEQGNMRVYRPCAGSAFPNRTLVARLCDTVDSRLLQVLAAMGLQEHQTVLAFIDRFHKQPAYHFLHSRLGLTARDDIDQTGAASPDKRSSIERSKEALRSYRAALAERGSQFLLFVMPNHTNHPAGDGSVPAWLSDLQEESFNVISINSSTTPLSTLSSWWMDEDSHWREESIEFSAGLIWKEISTLSARSGHPLAGAQ
jgi:hypothetical protein